MPEKVLIDLIIAHLQPLRQEAYDLLAPLPALKISSLADGQKKVYDENGHIYLVKAYDTSQASLKGLQPYQVHALAAIGNVELLINLYKELEGDVVHLTTSAVHGNLWNLSGQYCASARLLRHGPDIVETALQMQSNSLLQLSPYFDIGIRKVRNGKSLGKRSPLTLEIRLKEESDYRLYMEQLCNEDPDQPWFEKMDNLCRKFKISECKARKRGIKKANFRHLLY